MKFLRITTLICLAFLMVPMASYGQTQAQNDVNEIKALILDEQAKANAGNYENNYSSEGAIEFWSSGGLMIEIQPDGRDFNGGEQNLTRKHIEVISLVPGKAAVAFYYSEGSIKPKNSDAVKVYRTRVSQTFVKEGDDWKIRSTHWSPMSGGSGTTQVAND